MNSQRLLFVMPDDDETYIAAMAAVSAYVGKLNTAGIRTEVSLVGPETWLSGLLVPPAFRMYGTVDAAGGGYDLAVELTQERAAQLANATSQSCATGFGYLLGFEGVSELVRINSLPEPQYDIGVLWWGDTADKFYESIRRLDDNGMFLKPRSEGMSTPVNNWNGTGRVRMFKHPLGVEHNKQEYDADVARYGRVADSWLDYAAVLDCSLLIGVRSPLTYLAACAGRAVIELYPVDEYEKSFFAKWSSNNYWMMLLENRQAIEQNYGTLWRSFERIWGQIGRTRRRRVLQPATVDATP